VYYLHHKIPCYHITSCTILVEDPAIGNLAFSGFKFADLSGETCISDEDGCIGACPLDALCYEEDGEIFWLQQRDPNVWEAYAPVATSPVNVTRVDIGDKLEATAKAVGGKAIRCEIVLVSRYTELHRHASRSTSLTLMAILLV